MKTAQTKARRLPLALAVTLACALLAACGSSSSSTTSTTTNAAVSGSGGASGANRTTLRACLKAHGVTLPARRPGSGGPPGGGGFFGGGGGGGLQANPKLAAAIQACGGARFRGGRRRLSRTAITQYVTCVRQHGFNLPAPNFSGRGPVFPANIRTNPKFVSASKSCTSLLGPPRPSGSASGAGAPSST